jgi:erythromycin esterase-like protein
MTTSTEILSAIRRAAVPLVSPTDDVDAIVRRVAGARYVLLGEATHGTHEFYRLRANITRALIERHGFTAVVVEADWPDAYRVNRWIRGRGADRTAADALLGFRRFPTWMWRNRDVVDLVTWLREWNVTQSTDRQAGFYGMDLYSLHTSIAVVLEYLGRIDPDAARRARYRYSCFDHFGEDVQAYGYATSYGMSRGCEEEVVAQLVELRRRATDYAGRDGRVAEDDYFFSEQNARVVLNAERYYRTMFAGRVESWNLRDQHMVDTIDALTTHLGRTAVTPRMVVWAHNSHLGDARATDMGRAGEHNVGQLMRQRHGSDAVLVGFTTHTGTVTAASEWDGPAERKAVVPSLDGSYERLLHDTGLNDFALSLDDDAVCGALSARRLERAIGVIYLPGSERVSHYFGASLARQFDVVIHIDTTHAVEPLETWARDHTGEPAETFPTGV